MVLIVNCNDDVLSRYTFKKKSILFSESKSLENFTFIPTIQKNINHKLLNKFYLAVSKQMGEDQWFDTYYQEKYLGFFVPKDNRVKNIYCYIFRFIPTTDTLGIIDQLIHTDINHQYRLISNRSYIQKLRSTIM